MTTLRDDALAAWNAGLAAADPQAAVAAALSLPRHASWRTSALVVATGKAAAAMARGVGAHARGFVLVPRDAPAAGVASGIEVLRADHPLPTREGLRASERLLAALEQCRSGARVLYLVSGGTSALFEAPRDGVCEASLLAMHRLLWGAGLPIAEMNAVRRAFSRVKGGGLLRALPGCEVLTLAVSDVSGDDPATIGSGPSVACDESAVDAEAHAVLQAAGLWSSTPPDVRAVLARPRIATPPRARSAGFEIVCSNVASVSAARAVLESRGYRIAAAPVSRLEGDASVTAETTASALLALERGERVAFVAGGETTVTIPARAGRGGRNLHLAAAAALRLAGREDVALLAAGTDGIDGNSELAGALVDGSSAARAQAAGYGLKTALERFDTASALAAAGDALRTGATETNVGDLLVAVSGSR